MFQHRLHLDLRRHGRGAAGKSVAADPEQRALDAAGVARPGPVPASRRTDRPGVSPALRPGRCARRADDLGLRDRGRGAS